MDRELVLVGALALFCLRDARLVVSRPRLVFALAPLLFLAAGACGVVAENLSEQRAGEILDDSRLWITALLLHAALGFRAGRKYRRGGSADWLTVFPTPLTIIGLTLGSRAALVFWDGVDGVTAGLALGTAYGLSVALLALAVRNRRDGVAALRYSSLAHFSALLLVPSSAVLDSPVAAQPVHWERAAIVLASVAALVTASFFWHRYRWK